jgi:hypothetical protein
MFSSKKSVFSLIRTFFQGYASACKYRVLKPLKNISVGAINSMRKWTFAPLTPGELKPKIVSVAETKNI